MPAVETLKPPQEAHRVAPAAARGESEEENDSQPFLPFPRSPVVCGEEPGTVSQEAGPEEKEGGGSEFGEIWWREDREEAREEGQGQGGQQ